jgi:hypothetical protein
MELQEKSLQEIVSLAALKSARTGRKRVRIFIPPKFLPAREVKVYRTTKHETVYGPVEVFCKPAQQGGWEVYVRFLKETFNPAVNQQVGKVLLEKLK